MSFSENPPGTAVQSCPLDKEPKPTYWLEIELLGEDCKPIPWEKYEVKLPDGKVAPGFLDGDGFARFEGLETAGNCQVRFPNLDQEAWEKIDTKGPKAAGR